MAQIQVDLSGAERDADEYIQLVPGRDVYLVDARQQIGTKKRFDGFPSCFVFMTPDGKVVSEVEEHRIRVVDCLTEGIIRLRIDFKKLQDSAGAEKERLEDLKCDNQSQAVVDAFDVASSVLDHISKIGDSLEKLGEKFLTEENAVAVQRVAGIMACAPFVGAAFAALLPVVESFNENNQVASKVSSLFERLDRLMSYLDEVLKYVNAKGRADTEGDRTFCIFMTLVDQCVMEISRVNKERHSKVWRRVKRLWRSHDHLKKLEDLDSKVTAIMIERTAFESMKSFKGISLDMEELKVHIEELNDQLRDLESNFRQFFGAILFVLVSVGLAFSGRSREESKCDGMLSRNQRLDDADRRFDSFTEQSIPGSSPRIPGSSPPLPNLPQPIELFGRELELMSLENTLRNNGTMASLSGGGGMGKSEIANTFARAWYEADEQARFVWWIESETEAAVRKEYLEMLAAMDLEMLVAIGETVEEVGKMATSDIAAVVWKTLSALPFDWLLVFDNVPESNGGPVGFEPVFFPTPLRGFNRGRVLFSSQSELFAGHTLIGHIVNIRVEPLSESAAVQMLLADVPVGRYDDSDEQTEKGAALQFSRKLGCLPLALATVSGYVLSRGITVQEYLDEFESFDITEAVSKALHDALAYAREQGMSDILDIVAFVYPDSIPLKLLGGDDVRGKARHLRGMSILRQVRRDVYSVHRLHQQVLKQGRSSAMATNALNGFLKSFDANRPETWQVGREIYLHVNAVHENQGMYEELYKKVLAMYRHVSRGYGMKIDLGLTLNSISVTQENRGDNNDFLPIYEEALAMYRHVSGDDAMDVDLVRTLYKIARCDRRNFNETAVLSSRRHWLCARIFELERDAEWKSVGGA